MGGGTDWDFDAILGSTNINNIIQMARDGDLGNIDLAISDISYLNDRGSPVKRSASNFGKTSDKAVKSDFALGIFNHVFPVDRGNSGIRFQTNR